MRRPSRRAVTIISPIPSPWAIWRTEHGRSKPSPSSGSIIIVIMKPSVIKAQPPAYAPSAPWIIHHTKAPGKRTRVIPVPVPGMVMPAGAPYHSVIVAIAAEVSRCIANIYVLRRCVIYMHIFCIIRAAAGRYFFNIRRSFICNLPRPVRIITLEPYTIL